MTIHDLTPAEQHNAIVNFLMDYTDRLRAVAPPERDDEWLERTVRDGLNTAFPGVTPSILIAALRDSTARMAEDREVRKYEFEREYDLHGRIQKLVEGLPEDMMIGQAVELRAAQGDEFAIWLQRNPHVLEAEIEIGGDE